ncbi:MAG: aldo/keto reductase [Bdellovibrionales bacterium]|nr:aldo/keto reductase [Bdellovibrionales bacterium]
MIERILLTEDMEVSRVCLGSWQVKGFVSSNEKLFLACVENALDSGINFFDTAEAYSKGLAEQLIGRALKDKREKAVIATKFSHNHAEPRLIRKSLETSLKRLNTDYIDLYQYHWPSPNIPLEESIAEMQKLKSEGKIRAIGVSNWMQPEWEEVTDISEIISVQNSHSLLWRRSEKYVLPLCVSKNLGLLAYSPIFQGILTKEEFAEKNLPDDYRKQLIYAKDEYKNEIQKCLTAIGKIAQKYEKTRSQVALRWVLDTPGVKVAIVGMTKLSQLSDNLGAMAWKLTDEDYKFLSDSSPSFAFNGNPHDTLWGWHSRKR